jgi:hypothetical protein
MLMPATNTYPRLAGIFDLLDCMFQEQRVQSGSIGAGLAEKIPNPLLVRIEYCYLISKDHGVSATASV